MKSNLIYLFITPSQTGVKSKIQFCVVNKPRSILYSNKIVYLQVYWFTGYNGIMIEHYRS